ncbi:MAG: roadblock/LC7 domain-containing protein [Deltaproteobacteria bacterium]|nr:roadblock/LC7 domain-containing protein [Deltaproteobacteria bacterium]
MVVEGMSAQINVVLSEMTNNVPEIEGTGLVSAEGLVIQVTIPPEWTEKDMDEDQISAMVSGLVGIAETSSFRFQKAGFNRVSVRFQEGHFTAIKVTEDCYLFTITNEQVKLGMLYLAMEKAVKTLVPVVA